MINIFSKKLGMIVALLPETKKLLHIRPKPFHPRPKGQMTDSCWTHLLLVLSLSLSLTVTSTSACASASVATCTSTSFLHLRMYVCNCICMHLQQHRGRHLDQNHPYSRLAQGRVPMSRHLRLHQTNQSRSQLPFHVIHTMITMCNLYSQLCHLCFQSHNLPASNPISPCFPSSLGARACLRRQLLHWDRRS